MKLFFPILALLVAVVANAGLPPTSLKGQSGSKVTTFNFETPHSQATTISGPTRLIETGNQNVLANPGGEGGTAGFAETGAGTLASETTAANVGTGAKSISFDATVATTDYLSSTAVAIPPGMYAKNGLIQLYTKGTSGETITLQAHDGTNILATATITQGGTFQAEQLNFAFPSSGNIELRLVGTGNTAVMYFDDFYLGPAINLTNVSQASFIGSAYIPTSGTCTPTRTNTALGALVDTDCAGATVEFNPGPGTIQTTDYDTIKFAVNNLPPGSYEVTMQFGSYVLTSNQTCSFSISDGTTQSGTRSYGCSTTNIQGLTVVGQFTYTVAGTRVFELFGASAANALNIANEAANGNAWFSIKRFPTSAELAVKPDQTPASWSGYHVATSCAWNRASASYGDPAADADCNLTEVSNRNFGTVTSYASAGNELPGIVFTPNRAGRYFVCANPSLQSGTAGTSVSAKLWDGTTTIAEAEGVVSENGGGQHVPLCGIYNVASAGSAITLSLQIASYLGNSSNIQSFLAANRSTIEWSIFQLDAPVPAPILVNSITSNGNGPWRMEAADLNCDAGSAITQQTGTWVSAIGNRSTTSCALTIAAGIFSATPMCTFTIKATAVNATAVNMTSSTAGTVYGPNADYDGYLMCMGAR